jgi:hypothetical protein
MYSLQVSRLNTGLQLFTRAVHGQAILPAKLLNMAVLFGRSTSLSYLGNANER